MECRIGTRGPGCPCSCLTTPQPFRFYCGDESPKEECIKDPSFDHWSPTHCKPLPGRDHGQQPRNPRPVLPHPSPSPDHGFKSNRSLVLTALSVSLQCDKSEGSWHPPHGRHRRETRGHMKINLPIFKDEDMKDTITYQSWRWNLYTIVQGVKTVSSSPMPSDPCKGILESLSGALGQT